MLYIFNEDEWWRGGLELTYRDDNANINNDNDNWKKKL